MSPESAIAKVILPCEALAKQGDQRPEVSPVPDPEIGNRQSAIENSDDWLPIWRIAALLNCTHRHARRELLGTDPALIRYQPQMRGAPIKLYHVSCHPGLVAGRPDPSDLSNPSDSKSGACPASRGVVSPAPEDLALAELRSEAVRLYIELRGRLPESEAARQVCAAYQAHPKTRHIHIGERLPGHNHRNHDQVVSIDTFSIGTLRVWHAAWNVGGLMALVPTWKGTRGRKRKDIPEALLNIVHAWAIKNPRADVRKAIVAARSEWPGDFPDVSYATWLRRLRSRDPEHFTATLGKYGVAAFRQKHSPDIQRDYSSMGYNDLWQLDDCSMDFYGLNWSHERLLRPFAYAIIRVATRQWIAVITTETQIVKDQVKSLLGLAFANPAGGIPAEIRFERGTVACDAILEELLISLGIKVHRTSMDGGARHANAFADVASGHAAGKGVIERAMRSLHNQPGNWDHPLQVGPMERTTSPANLETIKSALLVEAKAGRVQIRLTPAQWQAGVATAMELYNDTPHGALPEILDAQLSTPDALKYRHMSPNEYAVHLQVTEIKTLDEKLLPLFFHRGTLVPVGKNGFTLNNFGYGRFDADVHEFAGRKLTAFQLPEYPRVAYVHELGRCVEAWRMPKAGQEGNLIEIKRGIDAGKRNKYEALMAEVLASGSQAVVDQTRLLANPVLMSSPKVTAVSNSDLAARADRQTAAIAAFGDRQRTRDARFDLSSGPASGVRRPSSASPSRRGILARGKDMESELAVLNTASEKKGDPFDFSSP